MNKLLEWKKENSNVAGYAHFDEKFGLNSAWDYITDPIKVAKHSFFPFITYNQVFYKAYREDGKRFDKATNTIVQIPKNDRNILIKDKTRPICYSAHIDRCIYQYYGYLLNEKYNEYVNREQISESVVAYRTDLHKNNIHFAKEAFDFIKKSECNIIVGDFKGFFDNLDHSYLKNMLCKVLGVESLSNDWYAVYKNITKYSTWDLIDILKINGLITDEDINKKEKAHEEALKGRTRQARDLIKHFDNKIKELNGFEITDPKKRSKKLALTKEQFKQHKKTHLTIHKDTFGIPQGSSISAVLSNVYMIDFDKKIDRFIKKFNGMYLRYSDDFIIILPKDSIITFAEVVTYLHGVVIETDKLTLEAKKTQIYSYENNQIINITETTNKHKSYIDYLGFIFDGNEVGLRPKTVSKYYYRMYKKLNHIVKSNGVTKKGNKISYTELYKTYTQKGRNGQYDPLKLPKKVIKKDKNNPYKSGNFFSYVYKADGIFNPEYIGLSKVENPINHKEPITRSTQKHMLIIRKTRDKIDNKDILKTDRLILRKMETSHWREINSIISDIEVMHAWEKAFTTRQEALDWIIKQCRRYKNDKVGYFLAIEKSSGKTVGQMGLMWNDIDNKRCLEVGYILKKEYWHKGFAVEGALACLKFGFDTLNVEQIYATIRPENKSSIAVAEKIGMNLVGEYTKVYDDKPMKHLIYSISKQGCDI